MKKLFFVFVVIITTTACQKQRDVLSVKRPSNIELHNVTIQNGHLVFATSNDFDEFFSLEDQSREKLINDLEVSSDFTSYRKKKISQEVENNAQRSIHGCDVPEDLIEDNASFFSTLDQDGVVQIGNDLFKYDYCADKAYVISSADAANMNNYDDFVNGRITNPAVGWFPTYVDVLEAIAEGYRTMPDPGTVEGNEVFAEINSLSLEDGLLEDMRFYEIGTNNGPNDVKMDGKLAYFHAAIYFHFYGKEKFQRNHFGIWITAQDGPRDWFVNFNYKYLRKGRNSENSGSDILYAPKAGENKTDKTFYEGSRGLKKYFAQWDVDIYSDYVNVSRNGGSRWFFIFASKAQAASRMQNYIKGPTPAQDQYHYLVNNGY